MRGSRGGVREVRNPPPLQNYSNFFNYIIKLPKICIGPPPLPLQTQLTVGPPPPPWKNVLNPRMLHVRTNVIDYTNQCNRLHTNVIDIAVSVYIRRFDRLVRFLVRQPRLVPHSGQDQKQLIGANGPSSAVIEHSERLAYFVLGIRFFHLL